jgi:hypothetical protein
LLILRIPLPPTAPLFSPPNFNQNSDFSWTSAINFNELLPAALISFLDDSTLSDWTVIVPETGLDLLSNKVN